jgi:hypothetical protein
MAVCLFTAHYCRSNGGRKTLIIVLLKYSLDLRPLNLKIVAGCIGAGYLQMVDCPIGTEGQGERGRRRRKRNKRKRRRKKRSAGERGACTAVLSKLKKLK